MPEWADSEFLRQGAVAATAVLAVVGLLIWRFVQRLAFRLMGVGLILLLAVGVWFSRVELGECAETCSCRLLGQDIEVPACRERGTLRDRS